MFQWEAKVLRCQKEFDDISAEIKREMERFEINRAKDFKATVIKYLQDQMAHQQQVSWIFIRNSYNSFFSIFRSWSIGKAIYQLQRKLHENVHRLRQPAKSIWAFCKYLSLFICCSRQLSSLASFIVLHCIIILPWGRDDFEWRFALELIGNLGLLHMVANLASYFMELVQSSYCASHAIHLHRFGSAIIRFFVR